MKQASVGLDDMLLVPGGQYYYQSSHRFREGGFILLMKDPGWLK